MSMNCESPNGKFESERLEAWRKCGNARYKFLELVEKVKKITECTDIDQDKHVQLNLLVSAGILFGEASEELRNYMRNQIKYHELKEKEENVKKRKERNKSMKHENIEITSKTKLRDLKDHELYALEFIAETLATLIKVEGEKILANWRFELGIDDGDLALVLTKKSKNIEKEERITIRKV